MAIEYVYALHDFEPQNDDEIAFVAGERIEVLERDDAYGDGWWTGRNLAGREGIFPKDYTTPAGPLLPEIRTPTGQSSFNTAQAGYNGSQSSFNAGPYGSTLHPLTEENESDSQAETTLAAPKSSSHSGIAKGGGHVMAATMTDVQQAIDQLGGHRAGSVLDDGRSMSFASTRDDRTSVDGDHYRGGDERMSMFDDGDDMDDVRLSVLPENWHRDARRRLFERVDQMHPDEDANHRPPVGGEFSDESDDEEGHHHSHSHQKQHKLNENSLDSATFPVDSTSHIPRTDSPAKADSPTLATSRSTTLDNETKNGTTPPAVENTERATTPTPALSSSSHGTPSVHKASEPANSDQKTINGIASGPLSNPPPSTSSQVPLSDLHPKDGQMEYLPEVHPASPFTPIAFNSSEPPTAPSTATSPPAPYAAEKPAISSGKAKAAAIREKGVEVKDKATLSQSSSYVSFLPSPTTTTFNTAQSQSGNTLSTLSQSQSGDTTGSRQQPNNNPSASASQISIPASSTTQTSIRGGGEADHEGGSFVSAGNASVLSSMTNTSLVPSAPPPQQPSPMAEKKKTPPSEWTVDLVVEWAKSKGFDEGICNKFIEHEITGDVLLEMDVNMLKEIDIIAFGKRMKIANAINELRRPPSFESSDAISLKPQSISQFSMVGGQSTFSSAPPMSPQYSQSISHPQYASGGFAGGISGLPPSQSMSPSPYGYNASISSGGIHSPNIASVLQAQQQQQQQQHPGSPGHMNGFSPNPYVMISAESSPHTGDIPGNMSAGFGDQQQQQRMSHVRVDSDPGITAVTEAGRIVMGLNGFSMGDKAATIGHSAGKNRSRPLSLALSPTGSDGMIAAQGKAIQLVPEEEDDRPAFSDSDVKKRKKEIKSLDTASSHEPPDTPNSRSDTPSRASARPRSSLDAKPSERLSFFSAMSRSRKPAPRYSSDQSGSDIGSPNVTGEEKLKAHSKLYLAGPTRPPRVGRSKEDREKEKKAKEAREKEKRESKEREREAKRTSHEKEKESGSQSAATGVLRKRTLSGDPRHANVASAPAPAPAPAPPAPSSPAEAPKTMTGAITLKPGVDVLQQLKEIVGEPDHSGFMMKKGERYNTWKNRFFYLKGPHLYYLRSKQETRIKGYINIQGYKVIADEATHPGRYGFRIIHDSQKPHFFSSEEQATLRDWMKALMKATIDRDFGRPVISSCNIPTIPLTVAQAMNPAPRPPSPKAVAAAQRASRQSDSAGLSSRDAKVLMGIADGSAILAPSPLSPVPVRPSREMRRPSVTNKSDNGPKAGGNNASLIMWINSQLPDRTPQATDLSASLSSGLILFRLAESIKYGREVASIRLRSPNNHNDPPVIPDSMFDGGEERVDGLMKLFDFLVDNEVKLSGISMADVKEGRADKIIALVRSIKQWHERREAIAQSIGVGGRAGVMTWIQG